LPHGAARWSIAALFAGMILSAGCPRMYQSWYLIRCDSDIRRFGTAIDAAKDDAQRAAAYADRGGAYGEKARYSRAMKLIAGEEYKKQGGTDPRVTAAVVTSLVLVFWCDAALAADVVRQRRLAKGRTTSA